MFVLKIEVVILVLGFCGKCLTQMSGFIVGGHYAAIEKYPHSAFLAIKLEIGRRMWTCGSSILNQKILLSAAHCFEECIGGCRIMASIGNSNKSKGLKFATTKFLIHENYDEYAIVNDVSLIFLNKDIFLNEFSSRIIIMKHPPKSMKATVSGWGVSDDKVCIFKLLCFFI